MASPIRTRSSFPLSQSFPFCCFPLFLSTDHRGRLSYLSWLFFGTLHSNGNIFPFLLCFSLLFFSQLFVRPPQTTILSFCISFPCGWSWSLSPVQCEGRQNENNNHIKLIKLITWTIALSMSVKQWAIPGRATHDGRVMVDISDKPWSTGEGNGNPLQYSCLKSHEKYEKGKQYDTERWTFQVARCPICYWRRVEK